jgi:hypothetical protein
MPQALIDRTLGTRIGDLTSGGGLAAGFDGTTSQAVAASAKNAGGQTQGFIGKDWGSGNTKTVTGFIAYGSNDLGFTGNSPPGACGAITVTLQGSTDNFSASIVDLGNVNAGTNAAGLVATKLSGITTSIAYRYHRLKIVKASSDTKEVACAECQFYEGVDSSVGRGLTNSVLLARRSLVA